MTMWLSWSRLRTHQECKHKGSLQRAHKSAEITNARGFFPGTVTDRVVTDWLNNDPHENIGKMPSMVDAWIDRAKKDLKEQEGRDVIYKDSGDREQIRLDCIEAVTKIEPLLIEKVLPFEFQPAFRFKAPLWMPVQDGSQELVVLNGEMDILVRDPETDRFRVYDVKMTRDNDYWRKTVGQLDFYSLCTQIMFGKPAEYTGLLQPLCDKPYFQRGTPNSQLSELMLSIQDYVADVWANDKFPLTKNRSTCYFCDVKHACSRFKPVNGRVAL